MSDLRHLSMDDAASSEAWVRVALDVPLEGPFDYRCTQSVVVGDRVIVSFGRRKMIGLVVELPTEPGCDPSLVKAVEAVLKDIPPLTASWLKFTKFAADYYQRPLGEVVMPALPVALRSLSAYEGKRSAGGPVERLDQRRAPKLKPTESSLAPNLNGAQQHAAELIAAAQGFQPFLLYGVTGSGKTEVYLHAAAQTLARGKRVLLLVPEINLTPQFEQSLRARLEPVAGVGGVAVLHSALSDGERLRAWLRVQRGEAKVVLGTRLSIFAPLDDVGLIVVDEEHDPSYKQQDGLRYSARDLAVWRAHDLGIPVVLGSATPSLESWVHAEKGNYTRLDLPARAREVSLPSVRLVDTRRLKMEHGISVQLLDAMRTRLDNGEQVLIFLNRRGYAPVMHCDACGWISNCRRCTAFMVLHKPERRLRCHHCSLELRVPQSCPTCGNVDLQPLGRGTQRVEEHLHALFPEARILRIDADSTRRKGSAQEAFDSVHRGDVDILLGTQMVAKGHDFQRLTLVGVINPDTALFSQDYRASERLFAQLMQVAGRAGRAASELGSVSEVLVQTRYPQHPLYRALMNQDYTGFAASVLEERQSAGLPPFVFQALLRAEAKTLDKALAFLTNAKTLLDHEGIIINDPVPMTITRVAGVERAQLLLESSSRAVLQAFLKPWMQALRESKSRLRWSLEVDPVDI